MTRNLDCTMDLSLMEEAEMQIIMEDYASQEQQEAFDEPFVEDCDEPIIEDFDDSDNLEIYDDDELNDFLARSSQQDNDEEDDWDDEFEDYDESTSSEWTEEDSWWALTDGMYGDFPRNPIAYDAAMDAMGF